MLKNKYGKTYNEDNAFDWYNNKIIVCFTMYSLKSLQSAKIHS